MRPLYSFRMIRRWVHRLRGPSLVLLVAIAGIELYWKLIDLFDFSIGQTGGLAWLVAGPLTFFCAVAVGSLFVLTGVRSSAGPLKIVSRYLVLACVIALVIGASTAAANEWTINGLRFNLKEHVANVIELFIPMSLAAWIFSSFWRAICRSGGQGSADSKSEIPSKPAPKGRTMLRWLGAMSAAGGAIAAVAASVLFLLISGCEPPSVESLARQFPAQRKTLEQIISMSDQDPQMAVIDPTWLEPAGPDGIGSQKAISISEARWDQYRQIFRSAGIAQGIRRYGGPRGDAFIIVKSIGILDNGYSTGYLYCAVRATHSWAQVCNSPKDKEAHPYSGGDEGYQFIKLTDRWYAYEEGPG
jgi:hypothetical protein